MATNYSESTSGTLPFYNTAVEELLKKGQTQMGTGLGAPPPAMTLAGFSPLQQQAFAQTQAGVGAYQPLLNQSQQAIQASIAGSQFNPSQFQQFMNPYTSGVVDEIGRLGQERFQQEILPSLSNSFGGLGQFGSARQATMMADAAGRSQREVLGQQSQALNTGYNQSMDDYYNWAGLGVGANQQAGTQFGNLAQAQQNLNLGDVGALSAAGQQQQAFAQKQADLPLANWQQQQQYPWEQINQWANLFKVPAPQQNTQWQTSFKKGGLARFADGGRFPEDDPGWMIEPEVQEERDGRRIDVLLNELRLNPFDENLKVELLLAGVPAEDIEITAQMADAHSANPWEAAGVAPPVTPQDSVPTIDQMAAQFTSPQIAPMEKSAPLDPREDLAQRAMRMREEFGERARTSPALAQREERPIGEHLGEAMLRAGAEGPAHWGQLIGRTGKGYFDIERADEAENQARALSALKLEEQGLPNIPSLGVGARGLAGRPNIMQVRDTAGQTWLVDKTTGERELLSGPETEIMRAADAYGKIMVENSNVKDTNERARLFDSYRNRYIELRKQGIPHMQAAVQARDSAAPASFVPKDGDIGQALADIEKIQDPVERERAKAALQREIEGGGGTSQVSPISANILTPEEQGENKKVGEGMGNTFNMLQEGAMKSRDQLNQIDRLEGLIKGVRTNKLTPLGTELAGWAKAFGIDIDENLPNKQAFKALSGQFALQLRNPAGGAGMPGALSDRDLQFLKDMVPNLANDERGIELMLETFRKLSQRSIDVAKLARDYRKTNPRGTLDEGFYDALESWSDQNPLFGGQEPAGAAKTTGSSKPGAPKAGDVVDGYKFLGGNLNDPANWEQQ